MKKIQRIFFIVLTACLLAGSVTLQTAAQASQAYSWKNVRIVGTGFIPGIVYSPAESGLKYVRTDMGGCYRWDRNDSEWVPLLDWVSWDEWDMTGGESIAPDPTNADKVYIAAGTYTNDWSPNNGFILRSSDRGRTFQRTMLPFKLGGNMPGRSMGERLVVDPNKPSILYLGTRSGNGLWKSTDSGVSWAKVSNFPSAGNYIQDPEYVYTADICGVVWITFDPTSSAKGTACNTIYVGVADTNTAIYRSTNAGSSWQAVPGQPANGYLPHHGILGSNGMLYITYSDTCGPYDGAKGDVWKYDTGSSTWTNISPVPSTSADNYFGYGGLAVDVRNPNNLLVTTLNSWWPDANIYRSTNGGSSWIPLWEWAGYPSRTLRYTQDISVSPWLNWPGTPAEPEPEVKIGWMIGDIDINPFDSNQMMYGTGATIYGSDNLTNWDNGGTISLTVKAMGIEESAVLCLVSPPSGPSLFSGMYDVNGFRHESLTTSPSRMYDNPSIATTSIDFAASNPNFMVRVGNGKTADNLKFTGFSYDQGQNWFVGNNDISGAEGGGTVAAAADASTVVWAPSGSGAQVSYSTDNGNAWTRCQGLTPQAYVASDRVNANKFYAVNGGRFYVSTDKGRTFSATSAGGLPENSAKVKAVPGVEGDVWVVGGKTGETYGLWHSTDSGASFTKIAAAQEADVVGFGKAPSGRSYPAVFTSAKINNVRGIFRSDDGGASWIRINDDQHQYGWTGSAITGDPRVFGRVYLSTNGRGIIYGDPSGSTPGPTATPQPTATPSGSCGDVNSSGTTDIIDALMIAQAYVGLNPPGYNPALADVNSDGSVNIIDALMVAQYYVGLIGALHCY